MNRNLVLTMIAILGLVLFIIFYSQLSDGSEFFVENNIRIYHKMISDWNYLQITVFTLLHI